MLQSVLEPFAQLLVSLLLVFVTKREALTGESCLNPEFLKPQVNYDAVAHIFF